ncbi:MAG: hypothetical protein ACE5GN_05300, partial [Waddliaceae bacterium]
AKMSPVQSVKNLNYLEYSHSGNFSRPHVRIGKISVSEAFHPGGGPRTRLFFLSFSGEEALKSLASIPTKELPTVRIPMSWASHLFKGLDILENWSVGLAVL